VTSVPRSYRAVGVLLMAIVSIACLGSRKASLTPPIAPPDAPIRFEVWRAGDDGLTVRVGEAIEATLGSSPRFVASRGQVQGTLFIYVEPAAWRGEPGRMHVSGNVFLSSTPDSSGLRIGISCREERLTDCAREVWAIAERNGQSVVEHH
jgi:hypothetical protein